MRHTSFTSRTTDRPDVQMGPIWQTHRTLCAGQFLFHQGDVATFVYEVCHGVMRLVHVGEKGDRHIIGFAYPGDIIGFSDGGTHYVSCEMITPGKVVSHHHKTLATPGMNPALHSRLIAGALQHIGVLQRHLTLQGRRTAADKVAAFLHELAQKSSADENCKTLVHIPMPRGDIADYLGLTTETVSRSFTQLRKDGIIQMKDPHHIILLQPDQLLAA